MNSKLLVPLNLQLFAEEVEEQSADNSTETETKQETTEKTFTRSDIAKMIAAEKSKWQQDYEAKIEQERNEAAELAKLSEKERQQALIDKEKKQLEEERAAFNRERLLVEKGKRLQEIGISSDLATRILGNTAEEALEDVKLFKQQWDKALEAAVNERLKSSVDSPLATLGANVMPKVDTSDYQALLKLKRENPSQYDKLMGK